MITSDKRSNLQKLFVNLSDYSAKCPVGCRTFFAFVRFEDESECMWSNIFAKTRSGALSQVLLKFADCGEYINNISLQEAFN